MNSLLLKYQLFSNYIQLLVRSYSTYYLKVGQLFLSFLRYSFILEVSFREQAYVTFRVSECIKVSKKLFYCLINLESTISVST
jgi:hypothetical protein